jgi:predicted PurR-regulated permease PerM
MLRSFDLGRAAAGLFVFLAVLVCLYWAKAVLMPVALSVLLTFLLAPVVRHVERIGIGRVPAVICVVVLVFSLIGGGGYVIALQLNRLASDLKEPAYQNRFREKVTVMSRVQRKVEELQNRLKKASESPEDKAGGKGVGDANPPAIDPPRESTGAENETKPTRVIVEAEPVTGFTLISAALGTLGAPLAVAGLVITLVLFMLISREDLRNRLIRLFGHGRLTLTTRALDDAGERISRYLLAQSVVNGTFGLSVGIALYFLGLPYALLWAFLAASFRFIPYVGPMVAAVLPLGFSLFVFDGWQQPILIAGAYVALELVSNMLMEPLLYGRSAGVSQVALLIAIAFWTWLWGPIGLLLATPLTVCIVVLGRHVSQLEFISILLGDQPVLEKSLTYYQRLVAGDQDEATEIVEEFAREKSTEAVYDEVLIPALILTGRDRREGRLTDENVEFIISTTREILEDLPALDRKLKKGEPAPVDVAADGLTTVLGCPGRGEMDGLCLVMLGYLLDQARFSMHVLSPNLLSSEMVTTCTEKKPDIVVISSLPPGGLAQARYLLKRLKSDCPNARVLVGRWGTSATTEKQTALLREADADLVATTLLEARAQLVQVLPLVTAARETERRRRVEAGA